MTRLALLQAAAQDVLAEVKAPYLKYLKKRDKESWRLLVKLAQNKPCAATSYALAKVRRDGARVGAWKDFAMVSR